MNARPINDSIVIFLISMGISVVKIEQVLGNSALTCAAWNPSLKLSTI